MIVTFQAQSLQLLQLPVKIMLQVFVQGADGSGNLF